MIATLALLVSLAQPQGSLLSKVIDKPTGQNGYEEYVQAAIILDQPDNRALSEYVRSKTEATSSSGDAAKRPAAVPEGLKTLELYRLEVKKLQRVIDLVRAGNQKPVFYPNTRITPATLFPELAVFKQGARVIQHAAYVAFADGNSKEGVNLILEGLTFAEKIEVGGFIHLLVGRACTQLMYAAIDRHTPQIPVVGAERLRAWAMGADARFRSAAIQATLVERAQCRRFFDDFFTNPAELFEGMEIKPEDQKKWTADLRAVNATRRDEIYGSIFKRLEAPVTALLDRLTGAESLWLTPLQSGDADESTEIKSGVADDIAVPLLFLLRLYGMLGFDELRDDLPLTFARYTIQDRLLAIHCDAMLYRWKTGKNAAKLSELYAKEPIDPATGERYEYSIRPNGWFKLLCKNPAIGEVTIASRIAVPRGENDMPPPRGPAG